MKRLMIFLVNAVIYSGLTSGYGQTASEVYFTENRGQWDPRVLYQAQASGGLTWFIERDGFTLLYSVPQANPELVEKSDYAKLAGNYQSRAPMKYPYKIHALKFKYIRASLSGLITQRWLSPVQYPAFAAENIPTEPLSHYNNYFLGNHPSKWATDCRNYRRIIQKSVWPGVDIEWYGDNDLVEFTVRGAGEEEHNRLTINYHSEDLPDAAEFNDNGDGTGTFSWQTNRTDAGNYAAQFTLSDGENQAAAETFIIVNNVNSPPHPFDMLAPENGHRVPYNPDSLGTVNFVWEEARQDEGEIDTVRYWIMFAAGMTQYTAGPLDSTHYSTPVQDLADAVELRRESEITFEWSVWAEDSEAHVFASNAPWTFTIPALEVSNHFAAVPNCYILYPVNPNPFNSITQIRFALPKPVRIKLEAYNLIGQKVMTILEGFKSAGYHSVEWNASPLTGGLYCVRLQTGDCSLIIKALLVK